MATYRLSWPANPVEEQVVEYVIYQMKDGNPFSELARVPVTQTQFDIVNPSPGLYVWKVAAVNLAGEGSQSPTVSSPEVPSPPGQPTIELVA